MQDPGKQAFKHDRRERPHNGRARWPWFLEEERVQGPITASGVIGTNRDGEEGWGNSGSIYRFAKVYDKVDLGKLWSCLQSFGVNSRFLKFLQALYKGSMCRVKVNGQVSDAFKVNIGLRQGCVLSPFLFSLYITMGLCRC